MSGHDTYSAVAAGSYDREVAEIAGKLRVIADEVAREGKARRNWTARGDERPDYLLGAQRIVHTVMWGVANLHLDGLVNVAAEVHRARDIEAKDEAAS